METKQKTWEECCDEMAKDNGWDDWESVLISKMSLESKNILTKKAAELYNQETAKERDSIIAEYNKILTNAEEKNERLKTICGGIMQIEKTPALTHETYPTHKLILDSEGALKYISEWPLASNRICRRHKDGIETCQEICYFKGGALKTCEDKQVQQVIANGILFKNKEDEERLVENLIERYQFTLEKFKPYDAPEGVIIRVEKQYKSFEDAHPKLFAFIRNEPKEEDKSQAKNNLIKDVTQQFYGARADAGDSSFSLIHDFEIWLINYMDGYKVERIKP